MPAKRKKQPPLTRLTMNLLKAHGYRAAKLEHYNAFSHKTNDVWGADILAFPADSGGAMLVQATSWDNLPHRRRKLEQIPEAMEWAAPRSARQLLVVGWKKVKNRWRCKIQQMYNGQWCEFDLGL